MTSPTEPRTAREIEAAELHAHLTQTKEAENGR